MIIESVQRVGGIYITVLRNPQEQSWYLFSLLYSRAPKCLPHSGDWIKDSMLTHGL